MTAHALDTLAIAGRLKAAGFSESQAEAVTFVLRDASEASMSDAATKADLAALRADLMAIRTELKSDIHAVASDVQTLRTEMKTEVQALRTEMKTDIQALDLRLEARIEAGKAETIKWVVSAIGFQTIVLVGAVVAMSRLFQP